ncbi:glycoside hydrolase family 97 protein [Chitinophagaceae bacterium LB-8]|uniref:Glycoside hydrolase family 97 protein n=1 Tax=Paraflavisolibacter caeni TaxID=2982496 RepID=A0A9X2XNY7_9BACT|nr:glycoside hydrolase family 97 protein [Paraflavisolibacter caeni]MCU7549449.1 glycoside hydrolase family 97 protein [Paraflavisolibacter caeni]
MKLFFLLMPVVMYIQVAAQQVVPGSQTTIQSPDQNLSIEFYQKSKGEGKRTLYYSVTYKNKPVIRESALDLQLDNHLSESAMALKVDTHARWMENLSVKKITTETKDTNWQPVAGERQTIRDHYNAASIELVKEDNPIYPVHVQIRAYNEGAAMRFFFPENEKGTYYRVVSENTEFTLPEGTMAWHHSWAQAPYQLLPLSNWPNESERPLTLQLPSGLFACLAEAQMVDYSRTKFKLSKEKPNTIVTSIHDPADLISPFATPWRLIMVAEKPGELIEHNYVVLNLNEPNKIKDTSWVKPGKIMRVMSQTTDDALANIDFAVAQGLQYVLFDWKWYGPAFSFSSDATKVAIPNFDLLRIIQYGKEKGIGVWLYVNQQALLAQLDSLFATYKKWGVAGVKFGFVQVGSHRWTTWVEQAIQKAAENGIMVNIHDDWRPTGEQRTWPNLMTAEGIRGNEEMPDATHNTVLPFTRYIAGAADYTICYFDKRIKTTHAHQLAMAAVYYSPIQTLFWYDKPAAYEGEPELEFWKKIPTTWDETKVLQGAPGQFITTARRKGDEWFVGTLTNNESRILKVPLNFLRAGKKYLAFIYSDDPKGATKTKVSVEKRKVDSKTVLTVNLLPSGGQAIWLTPEIK